MFGSRVLCYGLLNVVAHGGLYFPQFHWQYCFVPQNLSMAVMEGFLCASCIVTGEDKTTTSGAAAESRVTVVSDFLGGDRDRSEDPRTVEVGT